jgi:hypothetical protein
LLLHLHNHANLIPPDLKNTSDDALPNYLNSLSFTQSHYYTDIRLALGYTAVAIAGVLFYVDWKLGWDVTKPYTLPAVLIYMVLNGAFTYWLWWVEGDKVYVGEKNGKKVSKPSLALVVIEALICPGCSS